MGVMRAMTTDLGQPPHFSGDVRIEFRVNFRSRSRNENPMGNGTVLMIRRPGIFGREHRIPFFARALSSRRRMALWRGTCSRRVESSVGPSSYNLGNFVLLERIFRRRGCLTSGEFRHKRAGVSDRLRAVRRQEGGRGDLLLMFNKDRHRCGSASIRSADSPGSGPRPAGGGGGEGGRWGGWGTPKL